jgi:hypothetical protein
MGNRIRRAFFSYYFAHGDGYTAMVFFRISLLVQRNARKETTLKPFFPEKRF